MVLRRTGRVGNQPTGDSDGLRTPNRPKAHVRALRWLSRREYSALELRARLETEGYPADEIQAALDWLQASQWQSDTRFAGSLARRRAGAYGSRFIKAELQQHQVATPAIAEALETLGQTDSERALVWLEKRSRGQALNADNRAKWYRALMARGFQSDDIRRALQLLSDQAGVPWTGPQRRGSNARFESSDTANPHASSEVNDF